MILVNFFRKMVQFSISQEILRADFAVKKSTNICSKDVKRSAMNGAKAFFDSWHLNDQPFRNSGPLKIRLLQCYVVLWIILRRYFSNQKTNCLIFMDQNVPVPSLCSTFFLWLAFNEGQKKFDKPRSTTDITSWFTCWP